MIVNLKDNLWQLYNEYSIKGVLIISREDFHREVERICIQNQDAFPTQKLNKGEPQ